MLLEQYRTTRVRTSRPIIVFIAVLMIPVPECRCPAPTRGHVYVLEEHARMLPGTRKYPFSVSISFTTFPSFPPCA